MAHHFKLFIKICNGLMYTYKNDLTTKKKRKRSIQTVRILAPVTTDAIMTHSGT